MNVKRCSKCGEHYDIDIPQCPGCRYRGYEPVRLETSSGGSRVPWEHVTRVLNIVVGCLMLVSLFMVWVQALGAVSYLRLLEAACDGQDVLLEAVGYRYLVVFIPPFATLLVLVAAPADTSRQRGAWTILAAGTMGGLGNWQLYDYLSRGVFIDLTQSFGIGFHLFTIASTLAALLGLVMAINERSPAGTRPKTPEAGASPTGGDAIMTAVVLAGVVMGFLLLSILAACAAPTWLLGAAVLGMPLLALLGRSVGRSVSAWDHMQRGEHAYLRQDYGLAAEEFTKVIAVRPRDPAAYRQRAMALRQNGKPEEALQDETRFRELSGDRDIDPAAPKASGEGGADE